MRSIFLGPRCGAGGASGFAAETLKLAIGQRGLWDSSFAEIGTQAGIFAKHGLELQVFYTSGGGETQQAVISGSADIGVSPGTLGVLGAFAKGAPLRIIAGEATGTAEYYFVSADSPVKKFQGREAGHDARLFDRRLRHPHHRAALHEGATSFQAKLVATGTVPATFTPVMCGQVDIGFSTRRSDSMRRSRARSCCRARQRPRRVCAPDGTGDGRQRERSHEAPRCLRPLIKAYREVIDWMYADRGDRGLREICRDHARHAQTVRDKFYPKSMLQLDEVEGMRSRCRMLSRSSTFRRR